ENLPKMMRSPLEPSPPAPEVPQAADAQPRRFSHRLNHATKLEQIKLEPEEELGARRPAVKRELEVQQRPPVKIELE
ncbi:unnamed protein product, partial [Polarella glacialis]